MEETNRILEILKKQKEGKISYDEMSEMFTLSRGNPNQDYPIPIKQALTLLRYQFGLIRVKVPLSVISKLVIDHLGNPDDYAYAEIETDIEGMIESPEDESYSCLDPYFKSYRGKVEVKLFVVSESNYSIGFYVPSYTNEPWVAPGNKFAEDFVLDPPFLPLS